MRLSRIAAALVFGVVCIIFTASLATSTEDTDVVIGDVTIPVGQRATVTLAIFNVPEPGLGAWTVNIAYDPSELQIHDCQIFPGTEGVCNHEFSADSARNSGASAMGLVGDTALASITVECLEEGLAPLSAVPHVIVDATVGDPQDISVPWSSNVTIKCVGQPTATDTAEPTSTLVVSATPEPTVPGPWLPEAGVGGYQEKPWSNLGILIAFLLAGAGLAWISSSLVSWRFYPSGNTAANESSEIPDWLGMKRR